MISSSKVCHINIQPGDFLEEEKRGIKVYWKPDDSSVFGLQQHLKTVKINGFLGSSDTSAEFETTTESILDARDTEFVFVKFLLKNLTELETMIITTTEELNNFPALKKLDILFQLSSKLLAFPRSSTKAQVLLHPYRPTCQLLSRSNYFLIHTLLLLVP